MANSDASSRSRDAPHPPAPPAASRRRRGATPRAEGDASPAPASQPMIYLRPIGGPLAPLAGQVLRDRAPRGSVRIHHASTATQSQRLLQCRAGRRRRTAQMEGRRTIRHNARRVRRNSWKRDQDGEVERAAAWLIQEKPLHPTASCALSLPFEVSSLAGGASGSCPSAAVVAF